MEIINYTSQKKFNTDHITHQIYMEANKTCWILFLLWVNLSLLWIFNVLSHNQQKTENTYTYIYSFYFTLGDRVRLIIFISCLIFLHHVTCKNTTQIYLHLDWNRKILRNIFYQYSPRLFIKSESWKPKI